MCSPTAQPQTYTQFPRQSNLPEGPVPDLLDHVEHVQVDFRSLQPQVVRFLLRQHLAHLELGFFGQSELWSCKGYARSMRAKVTWGQRGATSEKYRSTSLLLKSTPAPGYSTQQIKAQAISQTLLQHGAIFFLGIQ